MRLGLYEYGELDMLAGVRLAEWVQLDQFEDGAVCFGLLGCGGVGLHERRGKRVEAGVDRRARGVGALAEQANESS